MRESPVAHIYIYIYLKAAASAADLSGLEAQKLQVLKGWLAEAQKLQVLSGWLADELRESRGAAWMAGWLADRGDCHDVFHLGTPFGSIWGRFACIRDDFLGPL